MSRSDPLPSPPADQAGAGPRAGWRHLQRHLPSRPPRHLPRHLPRDTRDTLFLLAVIGWTVLPHVPTLPVWCSAMTAVVLAWRAVLALRGAALPGRWLLLAVLVGAVAATLAEHRTLTGKDAGVTLLVVLVALKTLELRARRDAFAVFFLGFFLVLTHFFTSQSIAIAAAMLVSVWGLLTALVLAHMPVGQPGLAQAGRLAARFALLGAPVMVLLFVLFPRVAPLWAMPGDPGARTGLSGTLRMGMFAELATDDSIAMRVRVVAGRTPRPDELYFRGPVLGAFDGDTWRIAESAFPRALQARADLRLLGEPVDLEVTLEPLKLATLPVLDVTPELPPIDGVQTARRDDLHWMTSKPVTERVVYTARAWPRFEHGPLAQVIGLQDDIALPPGANPRTLAWAAALRREPRYAEADARTLAGVLLQRIRSDGYSYTLAPGVYDEAGRGTAVDEFWLDGKAGFCEHFAAAFVVVMRALDVPARIVTGYQGAELNPVDGTLVVRQSNAHAWAEYWQAGAGWIRADPTAAVAPDRIERGRALREAPGFVAAAFDGVAPDVLLKMRALWEATNHRWNQWVLNYTRGSQRDLLRRLGFDAPSAHDVARLLVGTLAALALAGAAWAWHEHRRGDPWLRAFAGVRRAAGRIGVPSGDGTAPRTLAMRLQQAHGARAAEAVLALHALEAWRYARAPAGGARRFEPRALARRAVAALRHLPRAPTSAAVAGGAAPASAATGTAGGAARAPAVAVAAKGAGTASGAAAASNRLHTRG